MELNRATIQQNSSETSSGPTRLVNESPLPASGSRSRERQKPGAVSLFHSSSSDHFQRLQTYPNVRVKYAGGRHGAERETALGSEKSPRVRTRTKRAERRKRKNKRRTIPPEDREIRIHCKLRSAGKESLCLSLSLSLSLLERLSVQLHLWTPNPI